ncbi:GerAB/ArcD/ProY family transporter [Clostridium grantii]|uniref:Spore germination protein (Amino acid permease) n=1 Tax=Clostridium grantii DSM 8605 TaxID=1121316 RepID=A0A1M5WWH2_9CLOT|nr:GerAB/ArcD/ProY family transporter [Clostridium grantii]SHH92055.1 spore germination protein (amino acid permease) [Clostridium grantii DSM 8605]
MDKQKRNLLTSNELTFLLFSFVIGSGVVKLPNVLVETAGQDAWISVIIALVYPIYVVFIASYIINKHPKENILSLTKKYFGSLLGSLLNFVFMLQFLLLTVAIISDFIILMKTYIVDFLTPLKIGIVAVSLAAYAAHKGLKVLAKTSALISYIFIGILLLAISALQYGSILNIQPVFGSGLMNILKTTKTTAYSYYGWEALLLFHPFVEDTKSIKKAALKAVALCGAVYVWIVFITIFYLGIDIIPKSYWSFIMVFESINIPIINNFRYIFMFVWIMLALRLMANYYFAFAFNLSNFTKIDIKKICILIYPVILYLSLKLTDRILRVKIFDFAMVPFIIFNLIFFTVTGLLISIKYKC